MHAFSEFELAREAIRNGADDYFLKTEMSRESLGEILKKIKRLAEHTMTFDNCYGGSLPCMPARRELHTGRYNFLHRSWGPLEPFDDSMPELLNKKGIHSHLATDHYHYFEDGGAIYHTRYRTWEGVRGQEGDGWKGLVNFKDYPSDYRNRCDQKDDTWQHNWIPQDFVNRSYMTREEDQPGSITFRLGMEFIVRNQGEDHWFLQIEAFDPYEPFFTQRKYKERFPHSYRGGLYDWPDYRALDETDGKEDIHHLRMEYAALLSMCDEKLGQVLDLMDQYEMWKDTLLIVNTDHGFLLSEHGLWAKCHCPFYNEVANIPLFVWDPRYKMAGGHLKSLFQTVDLPATILDFFEIDLPESMEGRPLGLVLQRDEPIRKAALFGIFGGQLNGTDGRYVFMKNPISEDVPLNQYTLMPAGHGGRRAFFKEEELKGAQLSPPFAFTKNMPVLKIKSLSGPARISYETQLFDLEHDPGQKRLYRDREVENTLISLMKEMMINNDCPPEVYV